MDLDLLEKYKQRVTKKYGSEYSSQLDMFLTVLNTSRMAENEVRWAKYRKDNQNATRANFEASKGCLRPLTHSTLGTILKGAGYTPGQSLYELLAYCKQARNFSAFFWWKIKERKLAKKLKR